MDVVVTGGVGLLGTVLARRLVDLGALTGPSGRAEEIERLTLFDAVAPAEPPVGLEGRVELVHGNVSDREQVASLVRRPGTSVFHLAAVLSAEGEQDFDRALRVNLHGTLNVLEACRARGGPARLVFTSTLATFGGAAMPDTVSDTTKQKPQTTYGTTKAVCELLVNDYTRKGFVDGRTARLPTVIVRPGASTAAASAFASAVFREPLAGRECVLPVGLDTRMAVIGCRTAVEGLIRLHEAEGKVLGDDRAVNLPSLSVTVAEMIESLERVAGGRPLGPIVLRPDPEIEAICRTWPGHTVFERARRLGLPEDSSLDEIVRAYVADFVATGSDP